MADQSDDAQIVDFQLKKKVTAKVFSAKFKSKREIYNFLSVDVGIYLPAYGKSHTSFIY